MAVSTLHFYETKGLISSTRNAGNQRRYPREVLRRVAVIKVAQRLGIPLASIRAALMTLPEGRTPTAADWHALSARWQAELDERIRRLTQLRDQLDGCIGCGCLTMEVCPCATRVTSSRISAAARCCWRPMTHPSDRLSNGITDARLPAPQPSID